MDAEQVLDHERGWVAIELAEALAEISREHPDILMAVVYQYLQWRARNVIDIACGDIRHVPLQVLCDIDKNKEEVLAEIRHMQKGYAASPGHCWWHEGNGQQANWSSPWGQSWEADKWYAAAVTPATTSPAQAGGKCGETPTSIHAGAGARSDANTAAAEESAAWAHGPQAADMRRTECTG